MQNAEEKHFAAIILGASEWPKFLERGEKLNGGIPFRNSGKLANAYCLSKAGLGLAKADVLNLFNSADGASDQVDEIRDFLNAKKKLLKKTGKKLTDVLIYYVGHGDFYGDTNDLLMLVKQSSPGNALSGLQCFELSRILKEVVPTNRQVIILDCCWSGKAIRSWQSASPGKMATAAAAKSVQNNFPSKGTLLICSSSENMPSMAPPKAEYTLFSGALFEALLTGSDDLPIMMSAREVKELAFERMEASWPLEATPPVVHGMERGKGDISDSPYFENPKTQNTGSLLDDVIDETHNEPKNARKTAVKKQKVRIWPPKFISMISIAAIVAVALPWISRTVLELTEDTSIDVACSACEDLIEVAGGEFIMGVPETEVAPQHNFTSEQHRVSVSDFKILRTEATFDHWQECVDAEVCQRIVLPDDSGWGRGKRPVINVNYNDVKEFISWLNIHVSEGFEYRLPSEAEWEYAARAGTTTPFSFGQRITQAQANFDGSRPYADGKRGTSSHKTVAVDELSAANPLGLVHIHGNVWELTQDCWHPSYSGHPEDGRAWLAQDAGDCSRRVIRGGGYGNAAINLRSGERSVVDLQARQNNVGFRVVLAAKQTETASTAPQEQGKNNLVERNAVEENSVIIAGECDVDGENVTIAGFHQLEGSHPVFVGCYDGKFKISLNHVSGRVSDVRVWQNAKRRTINYIPFKASAAHRGKTLTAKMYWSPYGRSLTGEKNLVFRTKCDVQAEVFSFTASNTAGQKSASCDGGIVEAKIRHGGGAWSRISWWSENSPNQIFSGYWIPDIETDDQGSIPLSKLKDRQPQAIDLFTAQPPNSLIFQDDKLEWLADPFFFGTSSNIYVDLRNGQTIPRRRRIQVLQEHLARGCDGGETCWRLATQAELVDLINNQSQETMKNGFLGLNRFGSSVVLRGYVQMGPKPRVASDDPVMNGSNPIPREEEPVVVYWHFRTRDGATLDLQTELAGPGTCDYNDCGFWLVRNSS